MTKTKSRMAPIVTVVWLIFFGWLLISFTSSCKESQSELTSDSPVAKIDYKQAYKQAIDSYSHLTIEELDYAVKLAFQQPSDISIPDDLMAAYMHRHEQKYKREVKEIKRLSQLPYDEFIRQVN